MGLLLLEFMMRCLLMLAHSPPSLLVRITPCFEKAYPAAVQDLLRRALTLNNFHL